MRSDLVLSRDVLMPGGFVVFDDIGSVGAPGVTAAVWQGVIEDGLIPVFQSRKLYGTWGKPCPIDLPPQLPHFPHEVLGYTMHHIEDAAVDVPERALSARGRRLTFS